MKVSELLATPARWTQGTMARNDRGQPVYPDSKSAVCWCLVGAVAKCYTSHSDHIRVMGKLKEHMSVVSIYNDTHTFEEVKSLVLELDI